MLGPRDVHWGDAEGREGGREVKSPTAISTHFQEAS